MKRIQFTIKQKLLGVVLTLGTVALAISIFQGMVPAYNQLTELQASLASQSSGVTGLGSTESASEISKEITSAEFQLVIDAFLVGIILMLSFVAYAVVAKVARRVAEFTDLFRKIVTEQDLTIRLPIEEADELTELALNYYVLSNAMEQLVNGSMESAINVSDASISMATVATKTHNQVEMQRVETGEITQNLDRMVQSINEVADNSATAAESATQAQIEAGRGIDITQQTIESIKALAADISEAEGVMLELESHGQEIVGIISSIEQIAEQTNLLALNAAIEAARAGESGRGFAVVADEVRNLAQRTQTSTAEIESIIGRLTQSTSNAVQVMKHSNEQASSSVARANETGEALDAISSAVNNITDINVSIAGLTDVQVKEFTNLSTNMVSNIEQFSSMSSMAGDQTSEAGLQLGDAVSALQATVNRYKITGHEKFSLHSAKAAHLRWVSLIRGFLDGKIDMDLSQAVDHHSCTFGQWYDTDGLANYADIPAMKAIEAPHADLHKLVREIVESKQTGNNVDFEAKFAQLSDLSNQVISHIESVESALGFEVRKMGAEEEAPIEADESVFF